MGTRRGSWLGFVFLLAAMAPDRAEAAKPAPAEAAAKRILAAQIKSMQTFGAEDNGAAFGSGAIIFFDGRGELVLPAEDMPRQFDTSSGGTGPVKIQRLKVVTAADGRSAWLSAGLQVREYNPSDAVGFLVDYRTSQLIAEKDGAWTVVAAYWTIGQADKAVNKLYAGGGTIDPTLAVAGDADEGDAEVAGTVSGALRERRFAELIDDRKDLIVIGSAPKEELAGGAKWKKAWAAWSDKLTLRGGVRAGLAPSGTTAWAVATFTIAKTPKSGPAYAIPFRLFVVLDRGAAGWRVVHAHLAIAA